MHTKPTRKALHHLESVTSFFHDSSVLRRKLENLLHLFAPYSDTCWSLLSISVELAQMTEWFLLLKLRWSFLIFLLSSSSLIKLGKASCGFGKKMKHNETFHLLASHFATNGLEAPDWHEAWIAKEGFLFIHMEFTVQRLLVICSAPHRNESFSWSSIFLCLLLPLKQCYIFAHADKGS